MTSRFHIVKIDTGPQKRGRWTCIDRPITGDQDSGVATATTINMAAIALTTAVGGSGTNSSRSSSHGAGCNDALSPPLVNEAVLAAVDSNDGAIESPHGCEFMNTPPLPQVAGSKVVMTSDQARQSPVINVDGILSVATAPSPAATTSAPTPSIGANPDSAFVRVDAGGTRISARIGDGAAAIVSTTAPSSAVADMVGAATVAAASSDISPASVVAAAAAQVVANCLAADGGNAASATAAAAEITGAATSALLGSIVQPASAGGGDSVATTASTASVIAAAVTATSVSGEPAAAVPLDGTLAIDNKIEQAMDLVKTHLRYAVREEVEVLKQRIQDLEKYVDNLEKENKLLREYAPAEILAQLRLTPVATTSSGVIAAPTADGQQQPQTAVSGAGAVQTSTDSAAANGSAATVTGVAKVAAVQQQSMPTDNGIVAAAVADSEHLAAAGCQMNGPTTAASATTLVGADSPVVQNCRP